MLLTISTAGPIWKGEIATFAERYIERWVDRDYDRIINVAKVIVHETHDVSKLGAKESDVPANQHYATFVRG